MTRQRPKLRTRRFSASAWGRSATCWSKRSVCARSAKTVGSGDGSSSSSSSSSA
ncbi:hypothetical protein ACFV2H_37595 [Streptomyces sp. NPDC059629]|uniref:hypothetical protein n=1 Tax=Streptomyces sp. NPDC059629 TaxID=3346889 RepID=UPI0036BAFAF5